MHPKRSVLILLTGLATAALTACAAGPSPGVAAREIDLAAFSADSDTATTATEPAGVDAAGVDAARVDAAGVDVENGAAGVGAKSAPLAARGPGGERAEDWAPVPLDTSRAPRKRVDPGERIIIDGMVGQVNGYPIFADAFFEPIEDKLIALRSQVPADVYASKAAQVVGAEMQQVVLNALFLAEAESELTAEEQQGIQAWMQDLASRVISGYEGSEELARRSIYEEQGKSFEAHMKSLRDQALIQRLLQERIAPRIIVSQRDIEREYWKRIDEFNPPPTITIARIRVSTTDTSTIDDVTRRLAAGETLVAIAETMGKQGEATWQTFEIEDGDLGKIDIANKAIKERLSSLRNEGDVAGPFEVGRTTWWLGIASIEKQVERDLYDGVLQRQLEAQIRQARGSEEQERYISSLMDKGIYDELEGMIQRLLVIALHRYGP